jgi:hypothetical protein
MFGCQLTAGVEGLDIVPFKPYFLSFCELSGGFLLWRIQNVLCQSLCPSEVIQVGFDHWHRCGVIVNGAVRLKTKQ